MIKPGQIWIRRKDADYMPYDVWKVRVVKLDRNGVVYKAIEYNGEIVDGVEISAPQSKFRAKYYPERQERE